MFAFAAFFLFVFAGFSPDLGREMSQREDFSYPESESGRSLAHVRNRTIDWKPAGPLGKEELRKHLNKRRVEGLMTDNIINNRLSPLPLEFFTKENTQRMYHGKVYKQ